jgi:hypothetical protein
MAQQETTGKELVGVSANVVLQARIHSTNITAADKGHTAVMLVWVLYEDAVARKLVVEQQARIHTHTTNITAKGQTTVMLVM